MYLRRSSSFRTNQYATVFTCFRIFSYAFHACSRHMDDATKCPPVSRRSRSRQAPPRPLRGEPLTALLWLYKNGVEYHMQCSQQAALMPQNRLAETKHRQSPQPGSRQSTTLYFAPKCRSVKTPSKTTGAPPRIRNDYGLSGKHSPGNCSLSGIYRSLI